MRGFGVVFSGVVACCIFSGALAAPVKWQFIDNYPEDLKAGVTVTCPGSVKTITSTKAVSCSINGAQTVEFSVVNSGGAKTGCTAKFDAQAKYDAANSTCVPTSVAGSTLVFSATQGIHTGTPWTISDPDKDDWPVTVTCPDKSIETIDSSDPVFCFVDKVAAGSEMTFASQSSGGCTAKFDPTGKFAAAGSTCTPVVSTAPTLSFSASQGILPATNSLTLGFTGTVKASCNSGNCAGTGVNLTDRRLALSRPLSENGDMTLGFSTTSGGTVSKCVVSFYNQFINNRETTCQNIRLSTLEKGFSANTLAFPANDAGTASALLVYPPSPASKPAATRIGSRTFTFENHCSQPVWFNLVPGTVGPPPDDGTGAANNKDANQCGDASGATAFQCPHGTTCRYVNDDTAYCFYDLPDPAISYSKNKLDAYKLDAKGGAVTSNSVTVPVYQENAIIFSGGASARIGCQDSEHNYVQCAIGNCNADDNALGCDFTSGTGNGATIAEFTMQKAAIDFYDISVINGAHIPVSMQPTATPAQVPDASKRGDVLAEYWCGSPGSNTNSSNSMLACNWNFSKNLPTGSVATGQAEKYYYINVAMPDTRKVIVNGAINIAMLNFCSSDSDCGDASCGLSIELLSAIRAENRHTLFSAKGANGKSGPFTCGERLGITTPVNICALVESGDDGYLNCNASFQQMPVSGTKDITLAYSDLYACKNATDNCIKARGDYTDKVCCGCTTWESVNSAIRAQPDACTFKGSGTNTNPYWDGSANKTSPPSPPAPDVQGKLAFLKQACPTAYVYQYDDATSTFNCYVDGPKTALAFNSTDYTVSFCPGETVIQ